MSLICDSCHKPIFVGAVPHVTVGGTHAIGSVTLHYHSWCYGQPIAPSTEQADTPPVGEKRLDL